MLYVESRKSFKGRREKKFRLYRVPIKNTRQTYNFAECRGKTLGKFRLCRVPIKNTRQTYHVAECWGKTLGKVALLPTAGTSSDGRRTCRSRDSILPSVSV